MPSLPPVRLHDDACNLYMTVFVVYAMDAWKYCNGVDLNNRVANIALGNAGVRGMFIEMSGDAMGSSAPVSDAQFRLCCAFTKSESFAYIFPLRRAMERPIVYALGRVEESLVR
jgi:hypothetical protein